MSKIMGLDAIFFTKGKLRNAISGKRKLASKGKKVLGLDTQQLHPRIAYLKSFPGPRGLPFLV